MRVKKVYIYNRQGTTRWCKILVSPKVRIWILTYLVINKESLGDPFDLVVLEFAGIFGLNFVGGGGRGASLAAMLLATGDLVVNLATLITDPLYSVADLFTGFAHGVTDVLGGKGVRVDVDVEAVVASWTVGLDDDAKVEGIDSKAAELLTDFVDVGLVEVTGARQDRRRLTVCEGELLASEDSGVVVVVGCEHNVGCTTSNACNKWKMTF